MLTGCRTCQAVQTVGARGYGGGGYGMGMYIDVLRGSGAKKAPRYVRVCMSNADGRTENVCTYVCACVHMYISSWNMMPGEGARVRQARLLWEGATDEYPNLYLYLVGSHR